MFARIVDPLCMGDGERGERGGDRGGDRGVDTKAAGEASLPATPL